MERVEVAARYNTLMKRCTHVTNDATEDQHCCAFWGFLLLFALLHLFPLLRLFVTLCCSRD